MKKILLALLLVVYTTISAQVTITMEQESGVYKVPCVVNGAKMKFIFDTGAATVCLSESMAEYLLDNDYISKEDFVGTGSSTVADGRTVNHLKIILRDIEIAGLHLKDVEASVVEGQRAPLLLGQTAIQKLGRISVEGNKLIIYNADTNIETQLSKLKQRAEYYDEIRLYKESLSIWEEYYAILWTKISPVDNDFCLLGDRCYWSEQWAKAIEYYTKVETKFNNGQLLLNLGDCYYYSEKYSTSNYFLEKALDVFREQNKYDKVAECYFMLSMNCTQIKQMVKSHDYASMAVTTYAYMYLFNNDEMRRKSETYGFNLFTWLENNHIRNDVLAEYIYNFAATYILAYQDWHCSAMRCAMKMGNTRAVKDWATIKQYCQQ